MLRTGLVVVRRTTRGFGVVQLDRQRGVGYRNRQGLPGVGAAEGDLLPADHDDAGGRGAALHPDRFGRWPGRGPGGAGAAQPGDLGGGDPTWLTILDLAQASCADLRIRGW